MHTIDLLEELTAAARKLGYQVRQEWLGESAGGVCELGGRKCLFINLALPARDQLDQVAHALKVEPGLATQSLSAAARRLLNR